jgi:glycosyltransferase involved in cell wall biosynthesis
MEGMASGLPVVATEILGMSELLAHIPGALTFPVDRPEIGADHILRLTRDPSLRGALGTSGREAMRVFDVRSVASLLLKDYEGMLGSAA